MERNKKLLLAGIVIIIGGTFMRFAWIIVNQLLSTVIMIVGSILFLAGISFFATSLFNRKDRF